MRYDAPKDDDDDSGSGEYMDHGVPYVLRVLYDRFWADPETFKPSKQKHSGSKSAFLSWLIDNFDNFDRKQLCHEAEVESHVCDQLSGMLENHSGQDIILTLWPVYTMATRDEPDKRLTAITLTVGFCFDDSTVAVMQSQTICTRTDPSDRTPLDDSSVMLALSSTVDGMLSIVADKGVDKIYKINNISLSSAYLLYNIIGKTVNMFKDKMTKSLVFLQQFIAGVFAPSGQSSDSAFDSDFHDDSLIDLKQEIADAFTEDEDDIDDFFSED
jgi:hypothetical protein